MTITNGYCTLAELKSATGITLTAGDTALEAIIEDASRHIDSETGRQFYAGSPGEVRYFTWDKFGGDLLIDDAVAVTAIGVDLSGARAWDTAFDETDYWLLQNRAFPSGPYNRIQLDPLHSRSWPEYRNGVKVTGTWGFNATGEHPGEIRRACILYAIRLQKRPAAPFGAIENSMGGPPLKVGQDADFEALIKPYRKSSWVFV